MRKSAKLTSTRASRWRKQRDSSVELSEEDGVRSLHLGSDLIQSSMRILDPYELEIAYTQCMMGFLLFNLAPKDIVMIGLGGGSLAKFVYRRLPEVSTIAVEINPQIIAAARSFFFLPKEGKRFRVVLGDGAEYVTLNPDSCDVLMVDGYEDGALPEALATDEFYADASAALRHNGIMVVNLLGRDRRFKKYLERITAFFPGGVLQLDDGDRGNVIIFAFRKRPDRRRLKTLEKRAKELANQFGLPFERYATEFLSLL